MCEPSQAAARMMDVIDALPPAIRLIQHEYGMLAINLYEFGRVRDPKRLRILAERERRRRERQRMASA